MEKYWKAASLLLAIALFMGWKLHLLVRSSNKELKEKELEDKKKEG